MKAKSTALLDIEKIFQASEDSQMNSQFLAKNAKLLERLDNRLGINRKTNHIVRHHRLFIVHCEEENIAANRPRIGF